jgi:predicted secreted protein
MALNGSAILLLVNLGTPTVPIYEAVGSQRGVTLAETTEEIDVSSKDGQAGRYLPGMYQAIISLDSLYVPDDAAFLLLRNALRSRTMVRLWIMENGNIVEGADAFVTRLSRNAPDQGETTISCTLRIDGSVEQSVAYLLHDTFTTDRAAGNVNGTAAEPGPGTRGVADTAGTKVLITGGKLQITGNGTWGQAGYWLTPAITRAAGLVTRCEFALTGSGQGQMGLTLAANAVNTTNVAIHTNAAPSLQARRTTAGNSPTIELDHATGIAYQVLRSTGRFIFLDIGSDVLLLWDDEWDNTGSLYMFVTHITATMVGLYDEIAAIQDRFYLVNALASDSFNRDNGVLGSTDGLGHLEANSGSGKAWTDQVGTWGIAGNAAACSALAGGYGVATIDAGTPHVVVQAETTRAGDEVGIVARWTDASNYLRAYIDGTTAYLVGTQGGAPNTRISGAITPVAGAKLRLTVDGTRALLHYNELYVGTFSSVGLLATGNSCGLYTTNTGNSLDNFQAWARRGYTDLRLY